MFSSLQPKRPGAVPQHQTSSRTQGPYQQTRENHQSQEVEAVKVEDAGKLDETVQSTSQDHGKEQKKS
jgi:hypothetical protein